MNVLAAINSIQDGILIIDEKGIVQKINPEYTSITGVEEHEIIGKPLLEVRPEAQLIQTLEDQIVQIGVYRNVNGREYVVDMAPIHEKGKLIGAVSICKGKQEVIQLSKTILKQKEQISWLEKKVQSSYQATHHFDSIIGSTNGLSDVTNMAKKAAQAPFPILITGESGTGKELYAQAIHQASKSASHSFVPINCAAIPKDLIESELFGYENGAFTSAKKGGKIGLFELADGGTIFLDEIGEMPYLLQSKLLRFLQEGTIRKIGGLKEKNIQTRIIAATNQSLHDLVRKGLFRDDLYYRLCVLQLQIPPLRERKDDIPLIVHALIENQGKEWVHKHPVIHEEAVECLKNYDWPGNVRELKNALQYALCMMEGSIIEKHHLPKHILNRAKQTESHSNSNIIYPSTTLKAGVDQAEEQIIKQALAQCHNKLDSKKDAAKLLNISLATLYNKMKKYQLN
ncbi:PAS domain-containing protein [Alkalicoccobacillus porphyridii]|uniref:PAS domain-containing protein n=1 Tax=Alkalicoccobacillus porphyridii TaxID=2597270 RepID=A0A553ZYL1_9BACI|nr:PAS domain-containing protein [Alkalicoccobacillus porphyridii]